MSFESFNYRIEGIAPLLLHSDDLANPLNPLVAQMKEVSKKRNKTLTDLQLLAALEWKGGHYWGGADGKTAVIPGRCLFATIRNGARRFKRGVDVERGLFILNDFPLLFEGPQDPEERFQDARFVHQTMARVEGHRVLRTRPIYHEWAVEFDGKFDCQVFSEKDLRLFLETAGVYAGLGDWRPRFGAFKIA